MPPLSDSQKLALAALNEGMSVAQAARAVPVHAATVYRWMNEHPAFREASGKMIRRAQQALHADLLSLTSIATEELARGVRNSTKTALQFLEMMGGFDRCRPMRKPRGFTRNSHR